MAAIGDIKQLFSSKKIKITISPWDQDKSEKRRFEIESMFQDDFSARNSENVDQLDETYHSTKRKKATGT